MPDMSENVKYDEVSLERFHSCINGGLDTLKDFKSTGNRDGFRRWLVKFSDVLEEEKHNEISTNGIGKILLDLDKLRVEAEEENIRFEEKIKNEIEKNINW
uniref:Uncharacterized protein n=1 Tax=viral metagenome TaxID=1070528 RepID=A0A6M3IFH9_9ZZZZ